MKDEAFLRALQKRVLLEIERQGLRGKQREISLEVSLDRNPDVLDGLLNKDRIPSTPVCIRLMHRLGILPREVDSSLALAAASPRQVKVVGVVGRMWIDSDAEETQPETAPVSSVGGHFFDHPQHAYRMIDASMEAAGIFAGDFVVCVEFKRVRTQPQGGDRVVVTEVDDRRLRRSIRQVVITPTHFELWFRPLDPERAGEPLLLPRQPDAHTDEESVEITDLVVGNFRDQAPHG